MNNTIPVSPKRSFLSILIFFLCCWYLLLCSVHYLRQRPLWLDEQSVFKSVSTYQPADFFSKKLAVDQIFPRVYIFLIQKVSQPFDFNLLSVRFFSFISMITAFFIWRKVAWRAKLDQWQYFTFVLSWAASVVLIYYSAELKQYSMDVLAAGIFFWFLQNQKDLARNKTQYLIILTLLPLLGLFSYPAFLFFIFPLYNLLMEKTRNRTAWGLYCLAAAFTVGFVYFFDMRITGADIHTQNFSDYSVSFVSVGEFFRSWGEGTTNLFSRWFAEQPRIFKKIAIDFLVFGMLYMFYGFFRDIRKNKDHLNSIEVLAFPIYVELFILGCLGKYPFTVPRTSLFFCPAIFILTIKGIHELNRVHPYAYRIVHSLYLIFLAIVAVGISRFIFTQDLNFSPKIW